MSEQTNRGGIAAFYKERFNADPYALMAYFSTEIASVAADVGIVWDSIGDHVSLTGGKYRGAITATEKRYRKKVMVWGQIKRSEQGLEYPHLTFNNNVASIGSATWSGLSALWELYKREGGQQSSRSHERFMQQQAEKKAEREQRQAERERIERQRAALIADELEAYQHVFERGGQRDFQYMTDRSDTPRTDTVRAIGPESGRSPYLADKGISEIAQAIDLRVMSDRLGDFTAVPLYNVRGTFLGLQRLYADKKLQGTGVKMKGAHYVIGDIESADIRYAVEGFATGASIFLAEASQGKAAAVIVTFNVGNLPIVMREYASKHPGWRIINAADNDRWTRAGNAGLLAALDIHRELGSWAVVPNFDTLITDGVVDVDAVYGRQAEGKGPTDWNDFHMLAGDEATQKALRARDSKYRSSKAYYSHMLDRLRLSGTGAQKAALQAVAAGMMLVPIKMTSQQVIADVMDAIPAGIEVNRYKIKSLAIHIGKAKMRDARELRAFSSDALQGVQRLVIPGVRGEHGNTLLPDHLADLVDSLNGFIVVRAPMGAGKTEKLIAPLMQDAPTAAYIAHRISLLDDAAYRLNTQHYQHVSAVEMPWVSHLACCVNSLTNPKFYNTDERSWFSTLDTLCIDEASQVIRHTTTGPVDSPVRVMDALTDAMSEARRTILCDADANDSVIELCRMADSSKPITVIEVEGVADHITVDHTDDETVWQYAVDRAALGERVLIANDSAESAKKMQAHLATVAPALNVLTVHKDSKADAAVEAFLNQPNAEATRYDVLIYSPAISSGVSITTPHFQHHIGIFSGNTVSPSDAIQMLRRDRTARHYLIGIGHNSKQAETDRERLFRGLVAADVIACDYEETTDEILLRRNKTIFDELYLSCRTSENKARNDFANTLLLMLYADGYKVRHVEKNDQAVEASRKNRKAAGEIVFEKRLTLLKSVETPDDEEFSRLQRQELKSEAESAQVDRYNIVNQLCVEEIEETDVKFYDDRGISHVAALELLQATEHQAREYDAVQRRANVTLTKHRWKGPVRQFLLDTFETLGIDPMTGEGEFDSSQARQVLDSIMSSSESLERYNALRVGRYIDPKAKRVCATTVVKSILERLGMAVHKRSSHGKNLFSISEDSWAKITRYIDARSAKGVHSLDTHEPIAKTFHDPKAAPEAHSDASETSGDTLQSGVDTPDVNHHPLKFQEMLYARASRFKPIGISLAKVIEALTPDTKAQMLDGMDDGQFEWTLSYAAERLQKVAFTPAVPRFD